MSMAALDEEGAKTLARLPTLRHLTLDSNTKWADISGISGLGKSNTIRSLAISFFKFGDAELQTLESIGSLNQVHLNHTSVTADGVRAFRAARPNVHVHVHPPIPGLDTQ
ncbi:MAG: hypothetical protein MPJ50_07955 [Pirellulales bacterium]|nr:hypothetical protein [Pirellulales bacterium]